MPIRHDQYLSTGQVLVDPYTLSQTLAGTNGDDTIVSFYGFHYNFIV